MGNYKVTHKNADCTNAVSFFRCKSLDNYLQDTENLPPFLDESIKKMGQVEKCVQLEQITGKALSAEARKNLVDVSEALVFYLKERRASASPSLSEDEKFTVSALQLRLEALVNQFADNDANDYAKEISRISNRIKSALKELNMKNYSK